MLLIPFHYHKIRLLRERVGGVGEAGDAEVSDLDAAVAKHHDVLRLDVAVDDAARMRVRERLHDLRDEVQRLTPVELAALFHILLERDAVDELHDDILRLAAADVVDRDDIRVREHCDSLLNVAEAAAGKVGAPWQGQCGLIFPGDFIEVFEKTGLIYRLDRFVWELAVQKLAQWQKDGRDDLYISVNISTKDFYYMDVYETITSLVETYKIIPSTLKLEITETAIMTGTAGELEMIERFRKSGFQVEIDDFGSGYSSFNTLKDMDVDVLKIDMGFLRTTRPERLERSMSIINTIISLTKTLGLSVITEGVETKEQIDELTRMGCGIYQGYYFSKPIPVGQFEDTYL